MKRREVSGERLLSLRGKRSREVIAHELRRRGHATDAKALWRWENGRNQPSASVLPDYADVLGADAVEDLYGADEDEEASSMPVGRDEFSDAIDVLRSAAAAAGRDAARAEFQRLIERERVA